MAPSIRRLRIAVSGLGRMGARHANYFLRRISKSELVAAFTPDDKETAWAKENLEPWGVKIYHDYDDMLAHEGLEAVCVATVTTAHTQQATKVIEAGKHVLCEKPFSTSLEVCQKLLATSACYPAIKLMCGFSRCFDASYRTAHTQAVGGFIGRPTILRSQTCDMVPQDWEFFVEYAQFSGGIFIDCNIHDIDLISRSKRLASYSQDVDSAGRVLPKVKFVVAFGVTALQPKLAQYGDVDNGVGVVEFYGGQIVYFYSSRMNPPGQYEMTEVIGTKGKLTVNANLANELLESHLPIGVQRDIPKNYYERFEHAFVTEAQEFTNAVLENKDMTVDLQSSSEAVRIGVALQESLRSQKKTFFDYEGSRIDEAHARL